MAFKLILNIPNRLSTTTKSLLSSVSDVHQTMRQADKSLLTNIECYNFT